MHSSTSLTSHAYFCLVSKTVFPDIKFELHVNVKPKKLSSAGKKSALNRGVQDGKKECRNCLKIKLDNNASTFLGTFAMHSFL